MFISRLQDLQNKAWCQPCRHSDSDLHKESDLPVNYRELIDYLLGHVDVIYVN